MSTNRREFLELAAGGTLAVSLSSANPSTGTTVGAEDEVRNRQEGMNYRRLGRTGYSVSEIVFGGNEVTPENYEHVFLALDQGLNYLDTAPAYGRGQSELGYAEVIKRRSRDQFFLTSKISDWDNNRNDIYERIFDSLSEKEQEEIRRKQQADLDRRGATDPDHLVNYFRSQIVELRRSTLANVMEPDYGHLVDRPKNYKQVIFDSVEGSLKRLGTDHLDLMLCPHGASSGYELTAFPEIFEAFDQLKQQGKVRHLGTSSHSDPAGVLEAALDSKIYSMAMVAYNFINHRYLDTLIQRAKAEDFGVVAMKVARAFNPGYSRPPLQPKKNEELDALIEGDLNISQKAYYWALQNPNLTAAIANMVNAEQVRQDIIIPRLVAGR